MIKLKLFVILLNQFLIYTKNLIQRLVLKNLNPLEITDLFENRYLKSYVGHLQFVPTITGVGSLI